MTDSRSSKEKPSAKQLRYLRDLASSRGESFTYPQTQAQASEEIDRLKGRDRTPRADRRREEREVRNRVAGSSGDGAAIRDEEIGGFGSSASWR